MSSSSQLGVNVCKYDSQCWWSILSCLCRTAYGSPRRSEYTAAVCLLAGRSPSRSATLTSCRSSLHVGDSSAEASNWIGYLPAQLVSKQGLWCHLNTFVASTKFPHAHLRAIELQLPEVLQLTLALTDVHQAILPAFAPMVFAQLGELIDQRCIASPRKRALRRVWQYTRLLEARLQLIARQSLSFRVIDELRVKELIVRRHK
mmetsp:Transcript_32009/g.73073  ORF Transcript_32009/g.73073 Transcript_32009/m.73073 type:complete len:203 (-) Transcript_32009:676-1284(-)